MLKDDAGQHRRHRIIVAPVPLFEHVQDVAVRHRIQHQLQALEFGALFDIRPGKE